MSTNVDIKKSEHDNESDHNVPSSEAINLGQNIVVCPDCARRRQRDLRRNRNMTRLYASGLLFALGVYLLVKSVGTWESRALGLFLAGPLALAVMVAGDSTMVSDFRWRGFFDGLNKFFLTLGSFLTFAGFTGPTWSNGKIGAGALLGLAGIIGNGLNAKRDPPSGEPQPVPSLTEETVA